MSTIVNFSDLQTTLSATSGSQLLIRLDNSLSGSSGFGRITMQNFEKNFSFYNSFQSGSGNWNASYNFVNSGGTIGGDVTINGSLSATNGVRRRSLNLGTLSGTTATITSNATSADQFVVTLSGASLTATIGSPSNPYDSQIIMWNLRYQTNISTVALSSNFRTPITTLNWTVSSNRMDIMAAKYNALDSKWDVISFAPGYII